MKKVVNNMMKKVKHYMAAVWLLVPGMVFASNDNPMTKIPGINGLIYGSEDVMQWFSNLIKSEYAPAVLMIVGLGIVTASGFHVHHGIEEAKKPDGGTGSLSKCVVVALIGFFVGMGIVALGWSVNSAWNVS